MKIYLCRKCNETIPLDRLATRQAECGRDCELTLPPPRWSGFKRFFAGLGWLVLALMLAAAGLLLGAGSFTSIARMRRLERVPRTEVRAVLPGEINLAGSAASAGQTLAAPKSGATCFHYQFKIEREEKDSEGHTSWKTIKEETQSVDFFLSDVTGVIVLRAGAGTRRPAFHLLQSFRTREGNLRYTEWRIDPDDNLFVFGCAQTVRGQPQVRFDIGGHYEPIISKYNERTERWRMAGGSILMCWSGLVCLAFATGILCRLLRIHQLLLYFTILSAVIGAVLAVFGLRMMRNDLLAAANRLAHHEQVATAAVRESLASVGVTWNGDWATLGDLAVVAPALLQAEMGRLERIRLDLAVAMRRARAQREAFPERFLAPRWHVPPVGGLPLPETRAADLAELERGFEKAKVSPALGWVVAGICAVLAALFFSAGFKRVRYKRCIENLPTSPAGGAAYGLSEFKGIVMLDRGDEPLQGPITLCPCVQYKYVIKEWRKTGKSSSWVTIHDEERRRSFLCKDRDGAIRVLPEGARIISQHHMQKKEGRLLYLEDRLELNDPLYAIGECVIEPSRGDALQLVKPAGDFPFILSNLPEHEVMHRIAWAGMMLLNAAFSAALLLALALFGMSGSYAATDYLASALVAPAFMALVTLVLHFNDLVFLRERAQRNWANIDVSLKKRADLIPALEAMVKAYMAHEAGVQEGVVRLRSAYAAGNLGSPDAAARFVAVEQSFLKTLLGVSERYPELKANRQAALLSRTLVVLENEVALMRKGYNDAVQTYNTRISTLPDLVFAKIFGFRPRDFFKSETELIRVPPDLQHAWERQKLEGTQAARQPTPAPTGLPATAAQPAAQAAGVDIAAQAGEARVAVYASLLSLGKDARGAQLHALAAEDPGEASQRAAALADQLASADDVARLKCAVGAFEHLATLSAAEYRSFENAVRRLVEQDHFISLLEYAIGKALSRRLDPHFGRAVERPVRHDDLARLAPSLSVVVSRVAHAEERPAEMSKAAFDLAVSLLNYPVKNDLRFMPLAQCTTAAFDAALEEIAHSGRMTKANVLFACTKAVELNRDYATDQALLLVAMAEAFELDWPEWI